MRSTVQLSITLPDAQARFVRNKVKSGAYATESEVIRDGLRALVARDEALERWLRTEGVARYDASVAEPSRAIPVDESGVRLDTSIKRGRRSARR